MTVYKPYHCRNTDYWACDILED